MAGENTGKFGVWLSEYLDGSPYRVFYDHGDQQSSANVAKVKGFVGDEITRQRVLAEIDLMVAKRNGEAILLIELEESSFTPKLILGDVFTILMCNGLSVKQSRFKITSQTKLIVAGVTPTSSQMKRIENVIKPRLQQFSILDDSICLQNVRIVCNNDLESTVSELKEIVRTEFPSGKNEKGSQ